MEIGRRGEKSVEEKVRRILDEIGRRRKEAKKKGLNFAARTKAQIYEKLTKRGSPWMFFQMWTGSAQQGGTINYHVGINNPDPTRWSSLYVYVFIGPAHIVWVPGRALCTVDTRFPRLTMPKWWGLSLDPDESKGLDFSIQIPTSVEPTNYFGNSFLLLASNFDVGPIFDRANFPFEVV